MFAILITICMELDTVSNVGMYSYCSVFTVSRQNNVRMEANHAKVRIGWSDSV